MSKKRHNFFRLCSLVLAFMLTFTNMPAVAYATDGYSAEALVEDTAEASESDAITEDGEIEEEVAEPDALTEEVPENLAEEISEDAEEGEVDLFGVEDEEIEEEGDLLKDDPASGKWTVHFHADVDYYVEVTSGAMIESRNIPDPERYTGEVNDGWVDKSVTPNVHYTREELLKKPIDRNYELWLEVSHYLDETEFYFAKAEDTVPYGTTTHTVLDPVKPTTGSYVVEYSCTNNAETKDLVAVDATTGAITIDSDKGLGFATITAEIYKDFGTTSEHGVKLGTATYKLNVVRRDISFKPTDVTATYGSTFDYSKISVVGENTLLSGHEASATIKIYDDDTDVTAQAATLNAGTYTLKIADDVSIVDGDNEDVSEFYNVGSSTTGTLTIKKKPIVVAWPENVNATYTGNAYIPSVATGTDSDKLEVKTFSDQNCTLPITAKNVGDYYAKAFVTSTYANNYVVSEETSSKPTTPFKIEYVKLYVKVSDTSVVYDGQPHTLVVEGVYTDDKFTSDKVAGCTIEFRKGENGAWSTTVPTETDVETTETDYYVKATKTNYTDSEPVKVQIKISAKPMHVVVTGETVEYDDLNHYVTVAVYEGADVTDTTTPVVSPKIEYRYAEGDAEFPADFSTTNPPFKDPGTYHVQVKVTKANYADVATTEYHEATVKINKKTLYVTVTGFEGLYDGNQHKVTYHVYEDAAKQIEITPTKVEYSLDPTATNPWSTTHPECIMPNTYKVYVKASFGVGAESKGEDFATIKINKKTPTLEVTMPSWVYKAEGTHTPNIAIDPEALRAGLQITYKVKGSTAAGSATLPENVGNYVVTVVSPETEIYNVKTVSKDFSITKADIPSDKVTAPTPGENLEFDGTQKQLLKTGGSSTINELVFMYKAVKWTGESAPSEPTDLTSFSTTLPKGINAGKYSIFWYAEGPNYKPNLVDNKPQSVVAEIAKAETITTLTAHVEGWTYAVDTPDGQVAPKVPYLDGTTTANVAYWFYKDGDANNTSAHKTWTTGNIGRLTTPGDYYVYGVIPGDDNHKDGKTGATKFTIAKMPLSGAVLVGDAATKTLTYNPDGYENSFTVVITTTKPDGAENLPSYAKQGTPEASDVTWVIPITKTPITSSTLPNVGTYTISVDNTLSLESDYYTTEAKDWATATLTVAQADFPGSWWSTGDFNVRTPATWNYSEVANTEKLVSDEPTAWYGNDTYDESRRLDILYSVMYNADPYATEADLAYDSTKATPWQTDYPTVGIKNGNVGRYKVYYKVSIPGGNYKDKETYDSGERYVVTQNSTTKALFTIYREQASVKIAPTIYGVDELRYNGTKSRNLIKTGGEAIGGTILFSIDYVPSSEHHYTADEKDDLQTYMDKFHWYEFGSDGLKVSDVLDHDVYYYVKASNDNYDNWYDHDSTSPIWYFPAKLGTSHVNPSVINIRANDVTVLYGDVEDNAFTSTVTTYDSKQYYLPADYDSLDIHYDPVNGKNVGKYVIDPYVRDVEKVTTEYYVGLGTKVPANGVLKGFYYIVNQETGILTIEPAPVTVTVDPASKIFTDTQDPKPFAYSVEGLVGEDLNKYVEARLNGKIDEFVQTILPINASQIKRLDKADDVNVGTYKNKLIFDFALETGEGDLAAQYALDEATGVKVTPNRGQSYYGFKLSKGTYFKPKKTEDDLQVNYIITFKAGDFTIDYAQVNFTAPDQLPQSLAYNTQSQDLIKYGTAVNGTIYYQVVDRAEGQLEPGTAPVVGTEAPWLTKENEGLKRVKAGTYDVYYWVKAINGYEDIAGEVIDDPGHGTIIRSLGPITVTIAETSSEVTEVPQAILNLAYNHTKEQQDLVKAGTASNGVMKYNFKVCDPQFDDHDKQYKPDDFTTEWTTSVPKAYVPETYDVYYYVDGNDEYLDTPVYGPITVTIADTYAEVTKVPLANLNLEYNAQDQALVTDGKGSNGNIKYAVVPCNHDIDEHSKPHTIADFTWSYDVPKKTEPGTYDVYYYVDGTELKTETETFTGLYYVTTPVYGPVTVTIYQNLAKVIEAPQAILNLVYDHTKAHQNLVKAGTAEYGVMMYNYKVCDPEFDDHDKQYTPEEIKAACKRDWTDTVPDDFKPGTYDVYYYVDADALHVDTSVFGPITVTIADTMSEVTKVPVATLTLAYNEQYQQLMTDAEGINGNMKYAVVKCNHDIDEHSKPHTIDDFEWSYDVPAKLEPDTYDVYYYVDGTEFGVSDEGQPLATDLYYVTTPVYGPVTVTIADTYAEITTNPVFAEGLVYDTTVHPLITEKGVPVPKYGTVYYKVDYRATEDADPVGFDQWVDWNTAVPKALVAGYYDVYYYAEGSEWGGNTGLLYIDTEVFNKTVVIDHGYAKLEPAPTAREGLIYNDEAQQLLNTAGTAVDGTLRYTIWKGEGEFNKDTAEWTTKVEDIKETAAGTYEVYYYADGSEVAGKGTGLLYIDTEVGHYSVTIAKRDQAEIPKVKTYGNGFVPSKKPGEEGYDPSEYVFKTQEEDVLKDKVINLEERINPEAIGKRSINIISGGNLLKDINQDHMTIQAGTLNGVVRLTLTVDPLELDTPDLNHNDLTSKEIVIRIKGQNEGASSENGQLWAEYIDYDDIQVQVDPKDGKQKEMPCYYYTGSAIKPEIRVFNGDKTLVQGVDYTITYKNNVVASKNKKAIPRIIVKGKGNYTKSLDIPFFILQADLSQAQVGNTMVKYNTKMAPIVTYKGKTLKLNKDYVIKDGPTGKVTNTEDFEVTLQGIGNFDPDLDKVKVFTMRVVTADQMRTFKVSLAKGITFYYDGEEKTLDENQLVVRDAKTDKVLERFDDADDFDPEVDGFGGYVLSYSNNVNAGTVTVTATGVGYYKSKISKTFKIQPAKNASFTIGNEKDLYNNGVEFTNLGATPDVYLTAQINGEEVALTRGIDYKISYSNNKKIGMGTYKITFLGNYKGAPALERYFKINAASFENAKVTVSGQFVYNAKKTAGSNYWAKAGTNLFVSKDNVLLKTSEYKVTYYQVSDEDFDKTDPLDDATELGKKTPLIAPTEEDGPTWIVVKVEPKTANYVANTFALGVYNVQLQKTKTNLSKAKISVVKVVNGKDKAVKVAYTGQAIEFPAPEDDVNEACVLKMVINGEEFRSDSETANINDRFDVKYANNTRKGTAKIIVSAKDGDEKYVGSKVGSFSIAASNLKETLGSWMDKILDEVIAP